MMPEVSCGTESRLDLYVLYTFFYYCSSQGDSCALDQSLCNSLSVFAPKSFSRIHYGLHNLIASFGE